MRIMKMMTPRWSVLVGMIVLAALSRLLPHPYNFAPITAVALFGGAKFDDWKTAFSVPLVALLLGDFLLGFYQGMWVVYLAFALMVGVSRVFLRREPGVLRITSLTLGSSIFFYLFTNLTVWPIHHLFPKTLDGQIASYLAALPFFQNTLLGDAFYTAVLFGGWALLERSVPSLKLKPRLAR